MIKRKTFTLRSGEIIDVEEFHDGRYGAPGEKRLKKKKPTKEQMQKINELNRMRKARLKLLEYFDFNDYFATWTYQVRNRPPNMKKALEDFQRAKRKVQKEYRKKGYELFWIRNIERGTKGAWHIHIIVNSIPGTAQILEEAWEHGGTYSVKIKKHDRFNDGDFTELASYITKNENTQEKKQDGTLAKPRLKEASYNTSRNMPLPEPMVDKLHRWKKEPKPKKGYYIAKSYTGFNPFNGYQYRRYTMIRIGSAESSKILEKTKLLC